jgi:hypothetical protein
VDPALVGEWLFDEIGAGTARDTSGKGRDARLTMSATLAPGGVRGGALTVTGGGDSAIVDALEGTAFPASGTLSLHVRYTFDPADGVNRSVFDSYDVAREHLFLRRANGDTKTLQYALQPATSTYSAVLDFTLEPRTWAHVVMTWDAKLEVQVLYIDGREKGRFQYQKPFTPKAQRFVLGVDWVGQIDEVRLWDRVIEPIEVSKLP